MKKVLYAIVLYWLFVNSVFGQSKEGNNWVLGYPPDPDFPIGYLGGTLIGFNSGQPDTSHFSVDGGMYTSGTMSDINGNLLFYSNGCRVYNAKHEIMFNGDVLGGPGEVFDCCCDTLQRAIYIWQGMVALPWPKHPQLYKIIQTWYTKLFKVSDLLLESTIDMGLSGGDGEVIEKNKLVSFGLEVNGFLTSVRHGNGEDWWITMPEWQTRRYFIYRLDSLGLYGPAIQENAGILTGSGGNGQATFSPDGSRYAEVCFLQGQIMDFDRCTGRFSNPRVIQFNGDSLRCGATVSFSPDSRLLYVALCDTLYQYDLSVEDFNSTRMVVAQFDGVVDNTGMKSPFFDSMLLGPDDKIYMNSGTSSKALHIIHQPNQRGPACNFQKWGLELPTLHYGQMPNLPNFRLGAAEPPCGSDGCDTLPVTPSFGLFPNPATNYVIVSSPKPETGAGSTFYLYDALGRLLMEERMECLPHRIELADLPAAGYFYRVFSGGGERLGSGTLVKMNRK
jgi:hypothetical protein